MLVQSGSIKEKCLSQHTIAMAYYIRNAIRKHQEQLINNKQEYFEASVPRLKSFDETVL